MMRLEAEGYRGRCLRLLGATVLVWAVAMLPAIRWFGVEGAAAVCVSAVACLVPGCVVFRLLSGLSPSNAQVRAVLMGTGLRVAFGLIAAFFMHEGLGLAPRNYVVWLTVFYLVALLVETFLILPPRNQMRAN